MEWDSPCRSHTYPRQGHGSPGRCIGSRYQHSVGNNPREVRWTVTPSKEKDSDSSGSRETFINLMFWLVLEFLSDFFFLFFSFFIPFPAPSVVVVILLALWNLIKLLSFGFFFSIKCFVVINLCFYVGLLESCEVFLFLFFLFSFPLPFLFFSL